MKAIISRRKRAVLRSKIAGSDRGVRRCGVGNSAGIDGSMAICILDESDFLRATLAGRAHPVTKVEASARAAGLLNEGQRITHAIGLHSGGIAFGGDCDTTTGTWVRPGADDKVFHLDRAPEGACKTLEKSQLGDWHDESVR